MSGSYDPEEDCVTWFKDDGASGVNPSANETFEEIQTRRLSRRVWLKGAAAAGAMVIVNPALARLAEASKPESGLGFSPIALNREDRITVPEGYSSQVLVRWGDPILPGAPAFDIANQSKAAQEGQLGFNCDFLGWFSLPQPRSKNPVKGLLTVNHEYTDPPMMFPGYVAGSPTKAQVDVELAAHGLSVVEIERRGRNEWRTVVGRLNRRVTAETPMQITGPAAGVDWMKTSYDPTGTIVRGMLNNCGGGLTPWGTLLTCEENFNQYFANNNLVTDAARKAAHTRYGMPGGASERRWETHYDRFDMAKEPNEAFRFGWVVEIDPYDPNSVPKKRTALGRVKHEAATSVVAPSGQVVVYTGDDERFDYMYKFVTAKAWNPRDRVANDGLLDEGTLYVAKFNDDGSGVWLPLVFGQGPLTPANGFTSQADVLIRTRQAADALGATKMDRPEDIETNPVNGKVYCAMTNNTQRGTAGRPGADGPNPRANNRNGHIIELTEGGNDPASATFGWEIFMLCGDPADRSTYFAGFDKSRVSPIASPDNVTFDGQGNLWIATDGLPNTLPGNDTIQAVPTAGAERGFLRMFLSGVVGCEVASLKFNADDTALFASIQHPGEGGTLAASTSHWPDGGDRPARPSVVAVVKTGGDPRIGS